MGWGFVGWLFTFIACLGGQDLIPHLLFSIFSHQLYIFSFLHLESTYFPACVLAFLASMLVRCLLVFYHAMRRGLVARSEGLMIGFYWSSHYIGIPPCLPAFLQCCSARKLNGVGHVERVCVVRRSSPSLFIQYGRTILGDLAFLGVLLCLFRVFLFGEILGMFFFCFGFVVVEEIPMGNEYMIWGDGLFWGGLLGEGVGGGPWRAKGHEWGRGGSAFDIVGFETKWDYMII